MWNMIKNLGVGLQKEYVVICSCIVIMKINQKATIYIQSNGFLSNFDLEIDNTSILLVEASSF